MSTFDIVVAGGSLQDGLGSPAVEMDLGIVDGRVDAIDDLAWAEARLRVDARGRTVAPGFIDIHSHSDFSLLVDPGAESALAQGVTTEVIGNCGHGCAPLSDPTDPRFAANIYGWGAGFLPLEWRSVDGYLGRLAEARPAINVAMLVPFGNLRLVAVADVSRPALSHEVGEMTRELETALDSGAIGLSTGLEYPVERAAPGPEVEALVSVIEQRDRLYATHTRDRGLHVVESTAEAIDTARATGARTQVSHILARRGSAPADANHHLNEALESAASEGLEIAWDVHTRQFGITNLSTALVGDEVQQSALRVASDDEGVVPSFGRAGWDRTFILEAGAAFEELSGRSVADVAADRSMAPSELLLAVLRDAAAAGDVHRPMAIGMTYEEADIIDAIRTSRCAIGSDGTSMDLGSRLLPRLLPGAFTWAAWFLRRVVRESEALDLPEAISRITSLPANQAGLADRGRLAVGARADVVVFDPASVREPADPIRPGSLASGMDVVLVNGRVAFEGQQPTGERAGEVVRA